MDENTSLFNLSIDPVTKTHLSETAKWARFLAIVGMVFLAFMVLLGVYSSFMINRFEESYRSNMGIPGMVGAGGVGLAVMFIVLVAVVFFPLLYTFRFANLMRRALNSNDQALLNSSFQNLKVCFRYVGIITIIYLVIIAIPLIMGIAGLALS